mgnify:FL=1
MSNRNSLQETLSITGLFQLFACEVYDVITLDVVAKNVRNFKTR